MTTENHDTFDTVSDFVNSSIVWNLTSEVVYTSLKYLKENPDRSIEEAISYGYYEWVK